MDPTLVFLINLLSVAFWGSLLVMFLRHVSRSEKYFDRVEEGEHRGDIASLSAAVETLQAERDRFAARLEAVETIVTSEGYELEREARAIGIVPSLNLEALGESPTGVPSGTRRRVH